MTRAHQPHPGFLDTQEKLSRRGGARWRNNDGSRLWEFDYMHGHIEGYNARGRHIGVFDAVSGVRIGEADPGRRIDV